MVARGVWWSQVSCQKKFFCPFLLTTKVILSRFGSWDCMALVRKEGWSKRQYVVGCKDVVCLA